MRRILAIAGLTLRASVRSRVLLSLAVLLLLAVGGLPLTVRGDGTIGGHVQILLKYTLGFAGAIIALASVWSGCSAVSTEVHERQIHLLMTKPVTALELWLGKWLGLLALNALLCLLAGSCVYALLHWTTREGQASSADRRTLREEILVARAEAVPRPPDYALLARQELERRRAAGQVPPDASAAGQFRQVLTDLRISFLAVPNGGRRTWTFDLPAAPEAGRPVHLQFRFATSMFDMEEVAGHWTLAAAGRPAFETNGSWRPSAVHTLNVPGGPLAGARTIEVTFENRDPRGATVFFDTDRGLDLMAYRGGFAANFARALLTLFLRAAFFAAVGLSAGSLMTMPVASFLSVALVLITQLTGYIATMSEEETYFGAADTATPLLRAVDAFFRVFFRAMNVLVGPLRMPDTLDLLATGRLVSWLLVGRLTAMEVGVYCGLLAFGCAWAFRRRELGSAE